MKRYFEYIELNFEKLKNQINDWLSDIYNKADILYNSTSPFGQVVNIIQELFLHNIIYLKASINQINIEDTSDKKMIGYIARIAGHNPSRPISASGTLRFKLKGGINILDEFGTTNPIMVIKNKTLLRNNTNNLNYIINLGGNDSTTFNIKSGAEFYINILQGKIEKTAQFTGSGDRLQTISINIPSSSNIDNFNFKIKYNGQLLSTRDHMYDMLKGELACWTRTGFNGGLDIYFGTENYGFIPEIGSNIEVEYLLTDGINGNIFNYIREDWKIIDDINDINGNNIDVQKLFDISIATSVDFSSDGEKPEFTKTIVPYVSRNFVLANTQQFIYHLKRLNLFSKVNAFNKLNDNNFLSKLTGEDIQIEIDKMGMMISKNDEYSKLYQQFINLNSKYKEYKNNANDNQMFLYLIPKIEQYLNDTTNYFNVPLDVFYLDEIEKAKIMNFLKIQGIIYINSEIVIIQPKISKYVSYVYIRRFDDTVEDNIKQEILGKLSDYFLNNNRTDRIIKAEIIKELKSISGIDSVDIIFVSQKNEDYHKFKNNNINNAPLSTPNQYDQTLILGIDPILGDILINNDELVIIRGGWKDRNDVYYNETPDSNGLNSVNIIFNGITNKK